MPIVHIHLIEGRDAARRAELIERVTDVLVETAGAAREKVVVVLNEVPSENWGSGGVPKSAQATTTAA